VSRIVYSMMVSIDGFIEGPNGEHPWLISGVVHLHYERADEGPQSVVRIARSERRRRPSEYCSPADRRGSAAGPSDVRRRRRVRTATIA
jgi:hypothetical protein